VKTSVEMNPKNVRFPNQPIQWHLARSTHDRCPRCGASLALLGRARRACMSKGPNDPALNDKPDQYSHKYDACPPGTVWESQLTPEGFLREMERRGEEAVPLKRGRPRKEIQQ